MLKFICHLLFAFLALSFSAVALAGTQKGLVTKLHKRSSDGLIYFDLIGPSDGKPACASYPYWMIKDENSNTGKQQLALLLVAKASGQLVSVVGNNTCSRWKDGEDVEDIMLE
ncbi:hypothetical protein ACFQNF_13225 [Iodobacter arcticus]|uniref:Secreted protein n=1 Tax=Iodobacter arcticus TaxID=590593 RepID=A0ABW2R0W2_9NEIS